MQGIEDLDPPSSATPRPQFRVCQGRKVRSLSSCAPSTYTIRNPRLSCIREEVLRMQQHSHCNKIIFINLLMDIEIQPSSYQGALVSIKGLGGGSN